MTATPDRNIVFVTRHQVEVGPWPAWQPAVTAWQDDITHAGSNGWAWHGQFHERPNQIGRTAQRLAGSMSNPDTWEVR